MEYVIQPVTQNDDLHEVARVMREAFGTVAQDFGLTEQNCPTHGAFTTEEMVRARITGGLTLFVAYLDETAVGTVAIEQAGEDVFNIERLAVLPAYRHHGIGRRLMDHACAAIRAAGGTRTTIGIIEENRVLKQWYQGLGFIETGIRQFPHLPFTVCFMERPLPSCK